jgi:hypothetical protein
MLGKDEGGDDNLAECPLAYYKTPLDKGGKSDDSKNLGRFTRAHRPSMGDAEWAKATYPWIGE